MSPSQTWLLCLSALDISGGSTLRPFLPIIAEHMGASALEIGFILSTYGFFQIMCGPLLGRLSDTIGRKLILQSSFFFSALTPLLILAIRTLHWHYGYLFVCIIPMAAFRSAQACIKSIIIDDKRRAAPRTLTLMAQWSCSCYVGATDGPLLVSWLSAGDLDRGVPDSCFVYTLLSFYPHEKWRAQFFWARILQSEKDSELSLTIGRVFHRYALFFEYSFDAGEDDNQTFSINFRPVGFAGSGMESWSRW